MAPSTTLDRLRVFAAVASCGSIAGAARSLGYAPSAVSQNLATLEREARTSLVERSNRGVSLTPAGRELAGKASDILDLVRSAFDEVSSGEGLQPAPLLVAAFPTAITEMLLPVRDRLSPSVELRLVVAEPEDALAALADRRVDVAIADGLASGLQAEHRSFDRRTLRSEPIHLVTRVDHLRSKLEDYAESEWVLSGPTDPIGGAVRASCLAAGFTPRVLAETGDHRITFDVILQTGAVSALPALALGSLPDGISVIDAIDLPIQRRIEFVTRRSLAANPMVIELAHALTVHAADTARITDTA